MLHKLKKKKTHFLGGWSIRTIYSPGPFCFIIFLEILMPTSIAKLWQLQENIISNPLHMVSKKIPPSWIYSITTWTRWKKKEAWNKYKSNMSLHLKYVPITVESLWGWYYVRHVTNRDMLLFTNSKILDFEIPVNNTKVDH